MANPRRGEVELELAGKPYVLVYDWNAISEIEAEFNDRPIDELFFSGKISRRAIREAVRAGLLRKYRPHTSKQVGRMISETVEADGGAFERIVMAIVKGLMAANGVSAEKIAEVDEAVANDRGNEEDAEARPPEAPGTGTT